MLLLLLLRCGVTIAQTPMRVLLLLVCAIIVGCNGLVMIGVCVCECVCVAYCCGLN
ncbi:hypothetical protein ACI2OX_22530 [Bacillus sp. N9]